MPAERVVVVTGGSRGIGAEVVSGAAAVGWTVCFSYVAADHEAKETAERVRAAGGKAVAVRADISVESDVVELFETAAELGPIRGLVANAGIVAPAQQLRDFSIERVSRMMEVNVVGTIVCCREAVRRMATENGHGGSIVLVSSAASRIGSAGEYIDYAASKGAVDTLGLGLAQETAAEGIRVNVVRPGPISTELHERNGQPTRLRDIADRIPLGRAGEPEEVAEAIIWLLGDASSFCTGSILDVAGGR